jgi:AcrR family transcriptional regulator
MPERRTQEERRTETRQKLLDATIRSLVDHGYPATTGRRVAEIAGVSRGAQTYHYPHLADLISDAVGHLADRRAAEFKSRTAELRGTKDQVAGVVDLFREDFSSDVFQAVVKVWVAAADDPVLRLRLLPLERHLRLVVRSTMAEVAAELDVLEPVGPRLDLVISAIRGLALTEAFEPRERGPNAERWKAIRPLLIEWLEGPA